MASVHPHSMAVATATAQAVEAHLRCEMLDRDARLVARYGDQLTVGPGPRALVAASGRVIAAQPLGWLPAARLNVPAGGGPLQLGMSTLGVAEALGRQDAYLVSAEPALVLSGGTADSAGRPLHLSLLGREGAEAELAGEMVPLRMRHAEILTLLCANPLGMSSEELSLGVYGDPLRAGSIRVEISRLRKLLGDCIETEQYRLRPGVVSDVAQVCGLLHRGEVREAAERYPGPLLPRSSAPGVAHEREALEGWLRQSVMSAGDQEALWAWLQTSSGATDAGAWRRLLANLPFADPRRSLAASRVGQLRSQSSSATASQHPV
jgi:hypothetical protein